jgi:hypothetical protein
MTQNDPVFNSVKQNISPPQVALVKDIQTILENLNQNHISDYSFLVAPAAKAYEGYLKDFFLKIGIIDQYNYESDRFRVGKTLNPSLRYKRYSIFQKLADIHQNGEALAELLWDAWKYGRNEILHYFPNNLKNLTRAEAEERIQLIFKAIIKSSEFLKANHKTSS